MNTIFYKNSTASFSKKFSTFVVGTIVIASFIATPVQTVLAERMTSGSYIMESDSVNFEGARSTSASYSLEDTGGEIATGDSSSTNSNLNAGFQQAAVAAETPETSPETTPSSSSSSGSVPYPVNVLNFTATPLEKSIALSWIYPQTSNIVSVRIVRSDKFFPNDISDGEIIFEGTGTAAIDHDVVIGTQYYYALFAKNSLGEYSSGVLAQARIAPIGDVTPPLTPGEIFENIPLAENVDPVISALTLLDLDFIQNGRKISQNSGIIAIDGKENLTIRLDYNKVPEVLKTIAISLSDPEDSTKVFSFLLRVNKDKTAYEATIAPLGRGGDYKLNAIVLDYQNQGLKRLNGNLRAFVLDEGQNLFGLDGKNPSKLWLMIVFLVVAFGAIILLVVIERRKKEKKKREAEAQNINKTISGLLMFFLVFVQTVVYIPNFNKVAHAAVNPEINYQGKLFDSSGDPVSDGTYSMVFNLYTTSSGGSTIWTESRTGGNVVQVTDGLFSILLGGVSSLSGVDFNQTLYLGVTIGSDSEMTPRKKLGTVPAAFVADTLDGLDSTQFLRSDATNATGIFTNITITNASTTNITIAGNLYDSTGSAGNNGQVLKISGGVPVWGTDLSGSGGGSETNWTYFNGSGVYVSTTTNQVLIGDVATTTNQKLEVRGGGYFSGSLGLGTTTPYAKLSVDGRGVFNQDVRANYFTSTSTSNASTFPYASTTVLTASLASTSNLIVSNTASIGTLTGLLLGTSGVVSSVSTSTLNIALSDTTGTLAVNRGGTGLASYTLGDVLYASGATTLAGTSTANLKTTLGLSDVENTALSTWPGSTSLTTLGTIATGIWNGTIIGDAYITKTGAWTGTFDGQEGSYYLDARNQTNFGTPFYQFFSATTTSALAEGLNLYWTNDRFDARLAATTTLPNLTTLLGLTNTVTTHATTTNATTTNLYVSGTDGLRVGSINGPLQANNGVVSATSSVGVIYGGTGASSFGQGWIYSSGGTGALAASTSPTINYLTSTSTATSTFAGSIAITEVNATSTFAGGIDLSDGCFAIDGVCLGGSSYGDTNTNAFIHGSSTIPKTYTTNTFTADQTFSGKLTMGYASSTGISSSYASTSNLIVSNTANLAAATIGSLNGLLYGTNGSVGTIATSSLGLATFGYLFPSNATSTLLSFNGGLTSYASTTIGGGTQITGLTINGGATTTGNAYFGGHIGVGTSSATTVVDITNSGTSLASYLLNVHGVKYSGGSGVNGMGINLSAAPGADSGSQNGGDSIGGSVTISSGDGGLGTAPSSSGGTAGSIQIAAGAGGSGSSSNGNGGTVYITGGVAGAGAGTAARNGNVILGLNSSGTVISNIAVGTSSPYAKLSVWNSGSGRSFEVVNSASTTNLWVSGSGFGTTTVTGLNISGSATSTSNVGFNLSGGCYAIGGICLSSGTSYTDANTNAYIHASSTIPKTYTDNTFTGANIFGGITTFNGAGSFTNGLTANTLSIGSLTGPLQANNGVVSATTSIGVLYGGTGWSAIQASAIPYGNGTGALATTTAGTAGYVLSYLNGIPTWTATTTFSSGLSYSNGNVTNTGLLSLAQTYGSAQTGAITFATSSQTTNGQTVGLNITNASGAFSFAPTISGTLSVAGGGTGLSSTPSYGNILVGNSSGGYSLTATSSLGLATFGYLFPSNATSTLLAFNGGLTSYASTTIGGGTQTTGLTISGGATTTGNLIVQGTGTSTFAGNVVIGRNNVYANNNSFAFGSTTYIGSNGGPIRASGIGSFAGGSSALGGTITASGNGSLAMGAAHSSAGANISASSLGSVALGYGTLTSSGVGSIALGYSDPNNGGVIVSSNNGSFAGGQAGTADVVASGAASFAFGDNITASNSFSTAFGSGFTNSTANSFMVGYSSTPTLTVNATSVGIGTTSPYSKLSVWNSGSGRSFEVVNSASTTNLWVSGSGFGTTTVTGLNISGSATSTSNVGFNLSGGCYAIGGVCLSSGTSYTNADTNAYIHASSTIPKTYTDNTFTGLQTFGNNISLGGAQLNVTGLTYGNLLSYNGTNWVNTSTSSLGIALSDTTGILAINRGGTGTSTAPSYGRLLLGNSLGGYDLVATSSLGLGSGTGTVNEGTLNRLSYYTGATAVSSADFLSIDASNSYLGIGTSTPYSKLSVWGAGTGTNRLFELTNSASTTLASVLENGTAYFMGNVGIGTTTPYAKLSVAGEVVASHFTATSTTATSTFAGSFNVGNGAITHDIYTGTTSISYLETGNMTFAADSGVVSWIDMPVTSASANGVTNSYSANLNGSALLTIYGVSNGSGAVTNTAVGIGTTSPAWKLSVAGNGSFDDYVRASYFTATSTTASTFPYASSTAITVSGTASTSNLIVSNNTYLTGLSAGGVGVTSSGLLYNYATSTWTFASSTLLADSNTFSGANTFTGAGSFTNGLTANALTIGSLTGPLQAVNGLVSASSTISVVYGGTGLSSTPSYGNILVGNSSGGYTLTATSSLGLSSFGYLFPSNATSTLLAFNGGLTSYASTTIGGGTQTTGLTINGGATTTGNAYFAGNVGIGTTSPSRTLAVVSEGGVVFKELEGGSFETILYSDIIFRGDDSRFTFGNNTSPLSNAAPFWMSNSENELYSNFSKNVFTGNVGIGTTTPYAKLSVVGQTVSEYFTATSTSIASTFPYASTTALTVSGSLYNSSLADGCLNVASGLIGSTGLACGAGGGGSFSWTPTTNYGATTNATGTPIWFQAGLQASSTSHFSYASTTALTVSGNAYLPGSGIWNSSGFVGIGTTSPYAKLSVVGQVLGEYFTATSTTATSTFAGGLNVGEGGFVYDWNTGVTSIGSLETGAFSFDTDAGQITWADLPVSSSAVSGLVQSYTAMIDNNPLLTLYGVSTGTGEVRNLGVGIGSTSPSALLSIENGAFTASSTYSLHIASTTAAGAWASHFAVMNNGNVGIGTSSPYAKLSVAGQILGDYFTATSTTATSTFAGGLNVGGGNFMYDLDSGITSAAAFQTGNLNFDTDAGMVSWADLALSSASAGSVQGYTAFLNGSSTISVYGVSAGSGYLQNDYPRISMGQTAAGTTTPTSKLTVFGNGTGTGGLFELVDNASTTRMKVLDNGNVGIGTTSPWRTLSATGTVAFAGLTVAGASGDALCLSASYEVVVNTGAQTCTVSSARFKDNITTLSSGLDTVMKLNPVSYVYKGTAATASSTDGHLGLVAEEVYAIEPRLVFLGSDGLPRGVRYEEVTSVLTKAIQEQQGQIGSIASSTLVLDSQNKQLSDLLVTNLASSSQSNKDLAQALDLTNTSIISLGSQIDLLTAGAASTSDSLSVLTASVGDLDGRVQSLELLFGNLSATSTFITQIASSTALVLASSTADILASSTPFLSRVFDGFMEFLTTATTRVKGIFVQELHVEDKLCVDDVCINKDQLKALLVQAGGTSASSTPAVVPPAAPTPTPVVSPESAPVPAPVPVVEPTPSATPASTTPQVTEPTSDASSSTPATGGEGSASETPSEPAPESTPPAEESQPAETPAPTESGTVAESAPEPAPASEPAPEVAPEAPAPVAAESAAPAPEPAPAS